MGSEVRLIVAPINCLLNAAAFNGFEYCVQPGIEKSSFAAGLAEMNPCMREGQLGIVERRKEREGKEVMRGKRS